MPWEQASRSVYPDGSFGNGAAMRAPVVAVIAHGDSQRVDDLAIASAEITHAHPLAVAAARLIAHACAQALLSRSPAEVLDTLCALELPHEISDKLQQLCAWFSAGSTPTHRELRRFVGVGMTATESPLAAIWGAWHGQAALPVQRIQQLENAGRIQAVGERLHALRAQPSGDG